MKKLLREKTQEGQGPKLSAMGLFLAVAVLTFGRGVKAQDDVLDDAEDALSSTSLDMDQIDIDGKLSPSELLKRRREKLEERNKMMVEKKIEDIRVKQEVALTNKLQDAFSNNMNNLEQDRVQTVQAAPVAPAPVLPAPVVETKIVEVPAPVEEKTSKIIPSIGTSSVKGNQIDLQSNLNLGLAAETFVHSNIAMGIGVNYMTMDLVDTANNFINYGYGYYNTGYYNTYGMGRKISFSKLTVDAGAKFYFTREAKIKPYAGAFVSFNRSSLNYDNNNSYATNGVNFGNEGFSSTAMAGSAKLGAEIDVSETIGFNVEFSYLKNITSGISQSANMSGYYNPDQARLENVTRQIEDAGITAIGAGLVIKF